MKWLAALTGTVLVLFLLLFLLLFTPPGNGIVGPVLEKKAAEALGMPVRLPRFSLSYDRLELTLELTPENRIEITGDYSLLSRSLRLHYRADLRNLAALEPLTHAPLRGPFATEGDVKGDPEVLRIDGTSDVAASETGYALVLRNFSPRTLQAHIRHADIRKLLYLAGEDPLASGSLRADIDLGNLDPSALKGDIDMRLSHGGLNRPLLKKRFGLDLPESTLLSKAHAALDGEKIDYTFSLDSSVLSAASKGRVVPRTVGLDIAYMLNVKELALLESLTGTPLRGPLSVRGKAEGDRERLRVTGSSDLAGSATSFDGVLKAFVPVSADVRMKHLKLDRLLYMLKQPHYASADIDLDAHLPRLKKGALDGTVRLDVKNGKADREAVSKAFGWPYFKGATFAFRSDNTLRGNLVDTKLSLNSDLLEYRSENIRFDTAKNILTSDFTAKAPDLKRLYFITERPMRGSVTASGDLRYDGRMLAHVRSRLLGGEIRATLDDRKLHADLDSLNTLRALYMLMYPEIFDARLDGTLDYRLDTKKGVLDARLSKGRFTRNAAFDLLRQYTTLNLYEERFKGNLKSLIRDKLIVSDLDLKSNRSSISTHGARFDAAAKRIDAKVHVDANNNPIDFYLRGNVENPKIRIDANKLIEREAGKQINRLLNDLFR